MRTFHRNFGAFQGPRFRVLFLRRDTATMEEMDGTSAGRGIGASARGHGAFLHEDSADGAGEVEGLLVAMRRAQRLHRAAAQNWTEKVFLRGQGLGAVEKAVALLYKSSASAAGQKCRLICGSCVPDVEGTFALAK